MQIVHIDDSYDPPIYTFSALAIRDDHWRTVFAAIRDYRLELRQSDGIFVRKEFHATEFVAGRGQISDQTISKWRRSEIFKEVLRLVSKQQGVRLFNVVLNRKDWAVERLLNRVNRALTESDERAILVFDQGNEGDFTKLVRKLAAFNPIPSRYGHWSETATPLRNIKIDRILEDPFSGSRFARS